MQVLFKEDLFKRLHDRRPRLKEEDFADIYRCMIDFLLEDIDKNSTPYYRFPHLGFMYLPINKASISKKTRTKNGFERYETLVKSWMYQEHGTIKSPLMYASMLKNFTKHFTLEELQKIQNGISKDI